MPPKGPSKKRKAAGGSSSDAVNGESGEATLPAPAAPTGGASIAGGQAYVSRVWVLLLGWQVSLDNDILNLAS